jgi:VanZ family protein
MRLRREFVRYQLPVIIWACLIFIESSIPGERFPDVPVFNADKLVHLCIYFVFCFFSHRAFTHQQKFPLIVRHSLVFSVVLTLLYGISDECHQYFVPGRSSDVFDVMADLAGGILCVVVISMLMRRRMSLKKRQAQED